MSGRRAKSSRTGLFPGDSFGGWQGLFNVRIRRGDPGNKVTWLLGSSLMMLQRFAVLLMMCRISALAVQVRFPGARVRDDLPPRSPI